MENYSDYIANYSSGIANRFYSKCPDDSGVAYKGYGGMKHEIQIIAKEMKSKNNHIITHLRFVFNIHGGGFV